MKQQSDTNDIKGSAEKQQKYVGNHRLVGMKRVDVDAAAVGLKDRVG